MKVPMHTHTKDEIEKYEKRKNEQMKQHIKIRKEKRTTDCIKIEETKQMKQIERTSQMIYRR